MSSYLRGAHDLKGLHSTAGSIPRARESGFLSLHRLDFERNRLVDHLTACQRQGERTSDQIQRIQTEIRARLEAVQQRWSQYSGNPSKGRASRRQARSRSSARHGASSTPEREIREMTVRY